jgi:hypothetical protein
MRSCNSAQPRPTRRATAPTVPRSTPVRRAIFDNYKNGVLPPAAALARDMVGLGVAEKTKDRARQLFERSADQAGFFAHGRNRLVLPAVAVRDEAPPLREEKPEPENGGGGGGGGDQPAIDPIIKGLLARLPKSGAVWPEGERKLWLELLCGSFKLIYKDKAPSGREGLEDVLGEETK